MKEQITITVTGRTGSGKSRLSVLLEEFLTAVGFDVEMQLNDGDIEDLLKHDLMDAISIISKTKAIKITEVNLAREMKWKT